MNNKDEPLIDDIRWLGRMLGDTVRQQQGKPTFDMIETIRRLSIQFHRDDDVAAKTALATPFANNRASRRSI